MRAVATTSATRAPSRRALSTPEPYKNAAAANEDFLSGDYGISAPSFFPVNPTVQDLAWDRIIDFLAKWLKD